MIEIAILLNNYRSGYENMAKDIREGMNEGFNEGLREGMKQGFIDGLKECRAAGFDNIDLKSMEEILKIAFEIASEEAVSVAIRKTVSREYKEKIHPTFKKKMEETCNEAVEDIKKTDFEKEKVSASELKNRVEASIKDIKECIGNTCGGIGKIFQSDVVYGSFMDSLQAELDRDLEMNLKACEIRICKEIDSKIDKKGLIMSDIKEDVKTTVRVFIQILASIVVRETTKKMVKNLTEKQKKKFEDKINDMSDDQLAHYFDKNPYFKSALENTVKSIGKIQSTKETATLLGKLQSIFETTSVKSPVSTLAWSAPKIILATVASTALLASVGVPLALNAIDPPELPAANFSSNITSGFAPLYIQFTDLSQNATARRWNFGDGTDSTEQNPVHTYSVVGKYTVELRVSNENGTKLKSGTITVSERPVLPIAGFSSNITSGFAPLSVLFTDLSFGAIDWYWDFGDGTDSTEQNPVHTYSVSGKHIVRLTVRNENGTDSKFDTITVIPIYAYITNTGSNSISIIDTTTKKVTASINAGIRPYGVAVSPDKTKVYVTNSGNGSNNSGSVSVIDIATNNIAATLSAGSYLRGIAVNPAGTKVYVANSGVEPNSSSSLLVIDTAANAVVATVSAGAWPEGVIVNPMGTKVYVANRDSDNVSVIDTATNMVTASVPVGSSPNGVAINPVGTKVYVANGNSDNISVINTSTNIVTSSVPTGKNPYGVTVAPDGTKAYVTNKGSNTVSVIDTATDSITFTVPVGENPEGVAVTPDGNTLFVANANSSSISVIDTATNIVTYTVPVGSLPAAFGQSISPFSTPSISPVANFSSNTTRGYAPLSVNFTDLSYAATEWNWSFGDGNNSTEQNPIHTYLSAGNYTAKLTAANLISSDSIFTTITVLEQPILPIANFSRSVTLGPAPLTVYFTDLSENTTGWDWSFGDGNNSTEQNTIHTYSSAGNYTVNLTAININGTNSKLATIIVGERGESDIGQIISPVANFSSDTKDGPVPLLVQFTDLSQNANRWNWDFGDGIISTEQNPTHTFFAAGNYTIILTSANANGTDSKKATINALKANPIITWSNPDNITYGTPLNYNQLNSVSSIPGTFNYTPVAGTVLSVGNNQNLHVEFTPTDTANYNTTSIDNIINVIQANPKIIWNNPENITYGIPLNDTQLNAFAFFNENQVDGTFTYTQADGTEIGIGTVLSAGTHALHADFTPDDVSNYTNTSMDVLINVSQANPTIIWNSPVNITYGSTLNDTQLNATATSVNGDQLDGTFVYAPAVGTVLSAGTQTLHVDFISSDANYTSASMNVTINVSQSNPAISWNNPANITYGTALNSTQLNAVAKDPLTGNNVTGNFNYNPGNDILLSAGTQTLHVDFISSDANYTSASMNVTINVSQFNPTITWNNPANITYGTELNSTQLNATATSVNGNQLDGTFVYTPAVGTVLSAGTHILHADFTPEDAANYTNVSKNITVNVLQATPEITWDNPADIVYGTALNDTQLNAQTSVPGNFVYTPPEGTILGAGTQILNVDFTPEDTENYSSVSKNVSINVIRATPEIIWNNQSDILYRIPLSRQLNAVASYNYNPVSGTFAYTQVGGNEIGRGTVLSAGTHTLHADFTPRDSANYSNVSKNVTINVIRATPKITWDNPADIVYGTALNDTQLNAQTSVSGTFSYTQTDRTSLDIGTVLSAGTQTLRVDLIPNDTVNYTTASKNVTINVSKAIPEITWSNPEDIIYGVALNSTQLNSVASVPGTFNYTPAVGTVLSAGDNQNLYVEFTPTDTENYDTTSMDVIINVSQSNPTITWSNADNITYGIPLNETQLNAFAFFNDIPVSGAFNYTQADGTSLDIGTLLTAGTHTLHADFTPEDAANYTNVSKNITVNVLQATPEITWDNPTDIVYGTPLNDTQLNATATSVNGNQLDGTFVYTPAVGTVLSAGTHTLHADFTPFDSLNYTNASKDVTINVSEKPVLPVANFSSNITSGYAPLTVQFADYSENATEWNWDFGDRTNSTQQNPTHTYSSAGNYTVNLTVSNAKGTSSANSLITVQAKEPVYNPGNGHYYESINVPDGITWEDAKNAAQSLSYVGMKGHLVTITTQGESDFLSSNPGFYSVYWIGGYQELGSIEPDQGWKWITGEDILSPMEPGFSNWHSDTGEPNNAGDENRLRFWGDNICQWNDQNENIPCEGYIVEYEEQGLPVANFRTDTNSGYAPLYVHFEDLSENATGWNWDFGDGNNSTLQSPMHTYFAAGEYTVNLTVNNENGTNSKLSAVAAFEYTSIGKWGSYGTGNGQFNEPNGVAVDSKGNVYVADMYNGRFQKFDSNGTFITKWVPEGIDGIDYSTFDIAVDSSGSVYVASGTGNVQKFDSNGSFIKKWGSSGTGDGQFRSSIEGVAVDSSGNVYVADLGNNRIQKFDSNGTFITKWGSYGIEDGQFDAVLGIAIDSSGNVYVADSRSYVASGTDNDRIQKFDSNGSFIKKWGYKGTGDGQFSYPRGIAVDSSGNVYVADSGNNRIQKFDSNGNFITKWGSYGIGDGQLYEPCDVAVDSLGNVYVADIMNNRIQKFTLGMTK